MGSMSDEDLMVFLSHLLKKAKERGLIEDRPHLTSKGRIIGNSLLREHNDRGDERNEQK